MTVDTMLPSTMSALFNVPKLAKDSSNCITYKERTLTTRSAPGLMQYGDGHVLELLPYAIDTQTELPVKPDSSNPIEKEIEEHDKTIDEYDQKNSLVKQQVFSMITDWLLLCVQICGDGCMRPYIKAHFAEMV